MDRHGRSRARRCRSRPHPDGNYHAGRDDAPAVAERCNMSFLAALAGMACLCLSMVRHQRDLLSRQLSPGWRRGLQWTGYGLLLLSFVISLSGGAIPVVRWLGELSLAALAVVALATTAFVLRQRPGGKARSPRAFTREQVRSASRSAQTECFSPPNR
ncbi:DUF3325 domain-containing protein [Novosphingobium sp. CF614]|uniref:DUF3325 domain-containing protein n=1 Tax=Novosphingobium sp. CF614 TaxID=1884364 RepID=UPI0035162EEB